MKNFQNYRRKNWTNYETQTRIIMMFFKQNQNVSFFDVDIDIRVRRTWTHNVRHTLGHGIADSNSDTDSDEFRTLGIDNDVRYC